ncbi:hypothetical protein PG993_003846 [Apiospora rasikravindrae]|uniref:CFEM domain-containing protein n=1 Tax=Apiospora rasikravindrae TaxID=990691 RepID=A0ABR1U2W3_9PEZI
MTRATTRILRGIMSLLFLIQFVQAQQQMPLCASRCLEAYLQESKCTATDFACICADQHLQASVGACTLGNCTLVEGLAAMNVTKTICKEPIRDNSMTTPVVTVVSATLAIIFVGIRLLNNHLRGSLNVADLCAVLALFWQQVSSIPMDISEFYMVHYGFGKDIWTLDQPRINNVVKRVHLRPRHRPDQDLPPPLLPARVPLAPVPARLPGDRRLRRRLQHRHLRRHRLQLRARPLLLPRLGRRHPGTCIDINAFWFSQATINIVTDLWIMALPIPQIFKLDLERKKKVFLCMMFCVGLLVTIFSIIRFTGLVSYSSTTNPTYNNVGAATWSVLECNVGIVCCCMPYVRSLLNRVFPHCFGGTFFSAGGGGGGKPEQKYKTMTSTTGGGDGTSKLRPQTTDATVTTDGAGGDGADGRKCGSRVSGGADDPAGRRRAARSGTLDTIEMAPMDGSLAKDPEW